MDETKLLNGNAEIKLNGGEKATADRSPTSAAGTKRASGGNFKGSNGPNDSNQSRVHELEAELDKMRGEKETLEGQYRTLLDRLSEMRNKIGLKIKQDAEELERREAHITTLTAQNEDFQSTVSSLQNELTSSNSENERITKELDRMRNNMQQQTAQAESASSTEITSLTRETQMLREQVQESQELLERARLEKEEWERILMEERVQNSQLREEVRTLRKEAEHERSRGENERLTRERMERELREEISRANNLETVLSEFQDGQENSIATIKQTYSKQMDDLTQSLAEFKSRALSAEVELQDSKNSTEAVRKLEKELKEKSILLAKVRQEAVTLNEHLTQALRRLRKFSADPTTAGSSGNTPSYVDRRLVTNILLQFITAPRADTKRFEMLNLLGSILGWNEEEREKAGLQRSVNSPRSTSGSSTPRPKGKPLDEEKMEDSFSNMWVEFLLKEASQGSASPSGSLPLSGSLGSLPLSASSSHGPSPSLFTSSSYAPSNYAKSNYAASSTGQASPTQSYASLPPLPPLPGGSSGAGNGHPQGTRSISGAFRLPSLARTKPAPSSTAGSSVAGDKQ